MISFIPSTARSDTSMVKFMTPSEIVALANVSIMSVTFGRVELLGNDADISATTLPLLKPRMLKNRKFLVACLVLNSLLI